MSGHQGTEALKDAMKLNQVTTLDRLLELGADANQEILASTCLLSQHHSFER